MAQIRFRGPRVHLFSCATVTQPCSLCGLDSLDNSDPKWPLHLAPQWAVVSVLLQSLRLACARSKPAPQTCMLKQRSTNLNGTWRQTGMSQRGHASHCRSSSRSDFIQGRPLLKSALVSSEQVAPGQWPGGRRRNPGTGGSTRGSTRGSVGRGSP